MSDDDVRSIYTNVLVRVLVRTTQVTAAKSQGADVAAVALVVSMRNPR